MATRKRDDQRPEHRGRKVVHHDPRKKPSPEPAAREEGPRLGAAERLGHDFTTGSGGASELGRRLGDPIPGEPPGVEVDPEQAQFDNPDLDVADEALEDEDDRVE
jgi:hypothetical protein